MLPAIVTGLRCCGHTAWGSLGHTSPVDLSCIKSASYSSILDPTMAASDVYRRLAGILGPHIRGYAVCSLPKLAKKLRAQAMTVVCVPILGSKWSRRCGSWWPCWWFPICCCASGYAQCSERLFRIGCWTPALVRRHDHLHDARAVGPELYCWYRNPERFFPRAPPDIHWLRLARGLSI